MAQLICSSQMALTTEIHKRTWQPRCEGVRFAPESGRVGYMYGYGARVLFPIFAALPLFSNRFAKRLNLLLFA